MLIQYFGNLFPTIFFIRIIFLIVSVASVIIPAFQPVSWLPWSACSYADTPAVFRFALTGEILATVQPTSLQPDEINRAQRYRQVADRNRFVYTRHLLRVLLGHYCQQAPPTIGITTGLNQKPELSNTDWHMNVSHAGDWILVAIGRSSVGVDVEWINSQFAFDDLMPTSFGEAEQEFIRAEASPRLAFYQLWTRKEALVKATAKGLDDNFAMIPSLADVHVVESRLLGADGDWAVQSFPVSEEYMGAVAYRNTSAIPTFYTVDSGFFTPFTS